MDKKWLIRTKSNHILGPVSKEKVQELFRNGSIKPDDEVCSGNGFWFFIREDDMVSKYLLGNEAQGFNPISEAKDILTADEGPGLEPEPGPVKDDLTMVGGISLSMLTNEPAAPDSIPEPPAIEELEKQKVPEEPEASASTPEPTPSVEPEVKKKIKSAKLAKDQSAPARPKSPPPKKQNWLKWLGIIGFSILLALVYFRKSIIKSLFEGEVSLVTIDLLPVAHAQEDIPQKKKLLDRIITLDEVNFHPEVGLLGFRVISSFNIEEISCGDLANDVYQLAIILHPAELINEKFLIKMRQCVLEMNEGHPLKRWFKAMGEVSKRSKKEQETVDFMTQILNSRYNLITDASVKTRIINELVDVPENTFAERILKSFLYLMIGNITKSDNILLEFTRTAPYENWKGYQTVQSLYQRLAQENIEQILAKLAHHPADRLAYHLTVKYLQNFYRSDFLFSMLDDHELSENENKLQLLFVERTAPQLVHHLRLKKDSEVVRLNKLRNSKELPFIEQIYWHWPFVNIGPLISEDLIKELQEIEKEDELWFIYLMDDEKLIDAYTKYTGKSFLSGRRQYLRALLDRPDVFMLALYKLIEFGDIDQQLIGKTLDFLIHE